MFKTQTNFINITKFYLHMLITMMKVYFSFIQGQKLVIFKRFEKRERHYNIKGTEIFRTTRVRTKLMERCMTVKGIMEQSLQRNYTNPKQTYLETKQLNVKCVGFALFSSVVSGKSFCELL